MHSVFIIVVTLTALASAGPAAQGNQGTPPIQKRDSIDQDMEKLLGRKKSATPPVQQSSDSLIDQELEKLLGPPREAPVGTLSECQATVLRWQKWNDQRFRDEKPLQTENTQLKERLAVAEYAARDYVQLFAAFVAIGLGIFVAFVIFRGLSQFLLSSSPAKKQLVVLVLAAMWISVAVVVGTQDRRLSNHPINLATTVVVYSLPAIMFATIAFWWFERKSNE